MTSLRILLIVSLLASVSVVHAQDDVHAAAAAFGEAQRAQLRGDFASAAELFEIADRSSPSPGALRAAIRNHRAANQPARAATLAAEASARYPHDAETVTLANETLEALAPTLARIRIRCLPPCELALDGRAVLDHATDAYDVFVDPGDHTVQASWSAASVRNEPIVATAGLDTTLALEPPAGTTPEPAVIDPDRSPEPAPPRAPSGGVHPALFGTLTALAAVSLAITIGSGIDTMNGASDYREDPTHARYDDGVGRELRTNVLIGITSALGIAALISVFFTDWDFITPGPDEQISLRPSFYASSDGGGATLFGRFSL